MPCRALAALLHWLWRVLTWAISFIRRASAPPAQPIDVVVVGAGFAGLFIARELASDPRFIVTVIEPKDYAEYTPAVMKAVVHPEYIAHIQVPLRTAAPSSVRIVAAAADSIILPSNHSEYPFVAVSGTAGQKLACSRVSFDVCVVATGSSYRRPYKADHQNCTAAADRFNELLRSHQALAAAADVTVVGGGPVGVELAAEIVHQWPSKRLTIVSSAECLLLGMAPCVSAAAERWLRRRGVRLLLGHKVVHEAPAEAAWSAAAAPSAAPETARDAAAGGSGWRAFRAPSDFDDALAPGPNPADCSRQLSQWRQRLAAAVSPLTSAADAPSLLPAATSGAEASERRSGWRLVTDRGAVVAAGVMLHCAGVVPNVAFLANERSSRALRACVAVEAGGTAAGPAAAALRGRIAVDDCLRLRWGPPARANASCSAPEEEAEELLPLMFAVGDAAAHPSCLEPQLGHTAEKHAEAVLLSLRRVADAVFPRGSRGGNSSDSGGPLWRRVAAVGLLECARYPQALTGLPTAPLIMDVSLGPWEALLSFDGLHLRDGLLGRRVAAALKFVIEISKVAQMRNAAAGVWFWRLSDLVALLLHRFLPPAFKPV